MKHLTLPVFQQVFFWDVGGWQWGGVVLVLGVLTLKFENRTIVGYGTY